METPSTSDMARMAQASYLMGQKDVGKSQRLEEVRDATDMTNYILNKDYTNSEMSVFQHMDNPKNVVISMRGTKVDGRRGNKDILDDLAIATGNAGHEKTFKRRKQKTNKIIKELQPTHLHMTSHSLGGATQNYTIANSKILKKYINDGNVFSAKSFNAGHHPVYENDMSVGVKYGKTLKPLVEHHRVSGDVVSVGLRGNNPFGKVVQKTVKYSPKKHSGLYDKFISGTPLGKVKNFTDKTLHAHQINHFIDTF